MLLSTTCGSMTRTRTKVSKFSLIQDFLKCCAEPQANSVKILHYLLIKIHRVISVFHNSCVHFYCCRLVSVTVPQCVTHMSISYTDRFAKSEDKDKDLQISPRGSSRTRTCPEDMNTGRCAVRRGHSGVEGRRNGLMMTTTMMATPTAATTSADTDCFNGTYTIPATVVDIASVELSVALPSSNTGSELLRSAGTSSSIAI